MSKKRRTNQNSTETEESKVVVTGEENETPVVDDEQTGDQTPVVTDETPAPEAPIVETAEEEQARLAAEAAFNQASLDNGMQPISDVLPEVKEETPPVVETKKEEPKKEEKPKTNAKAEKKAAPSKDVAAAPVYSASAEVVCTYDRGANVQLLLALNTLNECSAKDLEKVIRSRYTFYNNFFTALASAPTDDDAFEFLRRLLDAINARPFVTAKDRALMGFMRLTNLSNQQASMYQAVWKILLDTANPATRSVNARIINWRIISPLMEYHKRGDDVQRRLYAFFGRC